MIILIVIEVVRIQRNCGAASVDWGGGRGGGGGGEEEEEGGEEEEEEGIKR